MTLTPIEFCLVLGAIWMAPHANRDLAMNAGLLFTVIGVLLLLVKVFL